MSFNFSRSSNHWLEILLVAGVVALALVLLPQASKESWAYPMGYPPLPPSHLRADPGVGNIELTWQPSPSYGLKGYLVYRGVDPTEIDDALNTVNTPVTGDRWLDYSAESGQDYYYCLKAVDTLNQLSENCSNVSNATLPGETPDPVQTNELRIFVPDSGAPHGDTITIPVKIGNADGLTIRNADMWMIYDPSVITATSIKRSNLLVEYGFASNIRQENELPAPNTGVASAIIINTEDPLPALYGEATLFEVALEVKGTEGQTSLMDIPYDIRIGASVYGTTIYTDAGSPIPIIHKSGVFTVTLGGPNSPSYLMGDVSPAELGDGVIDQRDFAMAMSLAVGRPPNHRQRQVGDMNGDERINSADAVQIQQLAIGGRVATLTRATARALRATRRTAESVTLSIGRAAGAANQTVSLPIYATGVAQSSASASACDLIINYNPRMAQLADVRTGDLTSNFVITHTESATQSVRIGMIPTAPNGVMSSNSGVLVYLDFIIRPSAPAGWSPVTLASARLSDMYGQDFASSNLQIPVEVENGSIGTFRLYLPLILRQ
jgi:hypothetical protein